MADRHRVIGTLKSICKHRLRQYSANLTGDVLGAQNWFVLPQVYVYSCPIRACEVKPGERPSILIGTQKGVHLNIRLANPLFSTPLYS